MNAPQFSRSVIATALAPVLTAIVTVALTSACTLEPHYVRPDAPVDATLPTLAPYASGALKSNAVPVADIGWRSYFSDPALQQLIALALQNNRDLRVSVLNIEAARAQYDIQRADLFPAVNAGVGETAGRSSNDLTQPGAPNVTRAYKATVGITSYEVDLFGKVRSLNKAALEKYFGIEETRRAAQISLIASVANGYFTLLADRELLRVTQDTEKSQQASYNLTRRSLDLGVGTELTLRQAETALLTARANRALYTRLVAQDTDALVLLLGAPIPADLPTGSGIDGQNLVAELPAGLNSQVLIQRPDVLAAEHNLIAANADIGAARAAFFPSISLTGSIGSESAQLSGLFKSGSRTWSFVPQITLPIFSGGANTANLDLAKVQKNIQIATYEKTIQTAFREVSDALAGLGTLDDQLAAQQQLVVASQRSYQLADLRFKQGVDSYLTTLDSQRSLYTAQQGLVTVKLARLQNLVATYKVLGGGWQETTARSAAQ